MLDLGTLFAKIEIDNKNATNSLEEIKSGAKSSSDGIFNLGGSIKSLALKAASIASVTIAIKKVADAITTCVNHALELDKSLNGLQATTGATDEEMADLETSLKNIYANNYGEDFEDIASSLAEVKIQTGLAGEELEKTTENALAMRDTFDMDVKESIRSVDMMMKQFGLTSDEAYNLIAQGAQNGLNKNDNLLDSINEYSVHFKQLGFNAEQMFNMFSNGAQSGIFDIDKLGDAIKEFGIRAKDGSDTTVLAFEALGLNAEKLQRQFAQGGQEANNAFKEVMTALNEVGDDVVQNTAGVNLFGTMWEDLGADAVKALSNTNGAINTTNDNLENIKKIKYDDFGSAMAGIGRQLEVGIIIPIGEKILPLLEAFSNWLNEKMPKIQAVFQVVSETIGKAISFIVDGIKKFIDACNDANTNVGAIWTAIKEVISSVVDYLKAEWEENSAIIKNFIEEIKTIWDLFGDEILMVIKILWDNICIFIETALNTIKNIIDIGTALIKNDWGAVWESVKKLFSDIWQGIVDLVKSFLENIHNTAVKKANIVADKLKEIWTNIKNDIKEKWTEICDWFDKKINEIVDTVKGIKDKMFTAGEEIFTRLWDGIKGVWDKISSWVSDKVSWLMDKVSFWDNESSKMDSYNIDGRHRTGLRSVPFDNYSAILHKGEMVLTQPEAERYRQGKTNISNQNPTIIQNFYNIKEQKTAFQMKREVKNTIKSLGIS